MPKRPSSKGQGASVFFQRPASDPTEPAAPVSEEERVMVTIYLPANVAQRLDDIWLERKKKDRKAQKSHVVTEALEVYYKQLDG